MPFFASKNPLLRPFFREGGQRGRMGRMGLTKKWRRASVKTVFFRVHFAPKLNSARPGPVFLCGTIVKKALFFVGKPIFKPTASSREGVGGVSLINGAAPS